ncbi:MAG: UDP-N-acetylmuramoyl-L-alanine--D-glutamate ligase [Candidatus Coatesbacteria bacterium]|nr:UDP-N-acetylmuramoyl-L-alanine--D-glutamate ligase [Candidatus Coatesbacteria bacterium]
MRFKGDFKGMRIVVFGLGASGRAASQVLARLGAEVTAVDQADGQVLRERAQVLKEQGIRCHLGEAPSKVMRGADMVVVSPGVPTTIEPLRQAREAGAPVIGELELSFMLSDAEFLAVTGTKGKSTTARLLHCMLCAAGIETVVGGNLPDQPLCDKVLALSPDAKIVAEVSSFQLETISTFRPRVACITNLGVDHLDRYSDLEEYYAAKLRVCENQGAEDVLVVNAGDANLSALTRTMPPSRVFFGLHDPGGVNGVFLHSSSVVSVTDGDVVELLKRSDIVLPGLHNVENVMAAAAMAINCGVSVEALRDALKVFELAPHTLEVFAVIEGVTFVDDSHATNTLSVVKAIEAFSGPIVLIAGGRDKGCNFTEILSAGRGRVKTVIAIGEAGPKIEQALSQHIPVLRNQGDIADIVAMASSIAARGDVILLSPGCSSFDMFSDFRDRGNSFKKAVFEYFERKGIGLAEAE